MAALTSPARGRPSGGLVWWAVLVGAIEALVVGVTTSRQLYSDGFYNLVAGREIVEHGLSSTDPWTFLGGGRLWVDQQWLAHVTYYAADRIDGPSAVSALSALLIGSSLGLLALLLAARGATPLHIGIWCVIVGIVAEANAIVRAQSFAYAAFAVALLLLLGDWDAPSRRRRIALVATVLLWANLHGSVVAFVPLVALVWLVRALRDWRRGARRSALGAVGWIGAVCLAAVTTPYGLDIIGYYRSELTNATLQQHISEWQAASYTDPLEVLFFVALAATLVAVVYALWRRIRPSLPIAAGAVWFGYSGLVARRSEVWFAFFAALLVCEVLTCRDQRAAGGEGYPAPHRIGRGPAMLGATVVLLALLGTLAVGPSLAYRAVPLQAVALAARSGGPAATICADNESATPLEWLHPSTRGRVAFDARFELYSQAQLRGIFRLIAGPGTRLPRIFDRCDVLLVGTTGAGHAGLARTVRGLPAFRVTYDVRGQGLVAVRRGLPTG